MLYVLRIVFLCVSLTMLAACVCPIARDAGPPPPPPPLASAPSAADPEFLFVQTTTSGTLEGTTLTLHGVGPTLYFTDRPNRMEGHRRTSKFVANWGKGKNSFAEDPPNAVLSVFGKGDVQNLTVELKEPKLSGTTLSYTVEVLGGRVPASFGEASLFIDPRRGLGRRGGGYRRPPYHHHVQHHVYHREYPHHVHSYPYHPHPAYHQGYHAGYHHGYHRYPYHRAVVAAPTYVDGDYDDDDDNDDDNDEDDGGNGNSGDSDSGDGNG